MVNSPLLCYPITDRETGVHTDHLILFLQEVIIIGEFATNSKANAALTTGIIGTSGFGLAALNSLANGNGLLGGLFGGQPRVDPMVYAAMAGHGCSEDHCVNRYELGLEQANAAKDSEIALLKANIYGDQKSLEMYKYFDGELRDVRKTLCEQAVLNQKTADSFEMVRNDIICTKNELYTAISRERDERCCADNSIVTYANATFYPKQIADITTEATTVAQTLYNPLPGCGCGCRK